MVADVLEFRRRANGRATLARAERDVLRSEVTALKAELRDAGKVIPLARYVMAYVAADGVGLVTSAQSNVVDFLERLERRGGGGSAA